MANEQDDRTEQDEDTADWYNAEAERIALEGAWESGDDE